MTQKEAVALSGRSLSWLKRHSCGWCDQTALHALQYGCAAIWDKCDPIARAIENNPLKDRRDG